MFIQFDICYKENSTLTGAEASVCFPSKLAFSKPSSSWLARRLRAWLTMAWITFAKNKPNKVDHSGL